MFAYTFGTDSNVYLLVPADSNMYLLIPAKNNFGSKIPAQNTLPRVDSFFGGANQGGEHFYVGTILVN